MAEAQKAPEDQKSSLSDAAKDLKEYQVKEGDTQAQIQGKLVRLQTDRDNLQTEYDQANLDRREKDAVKLLDMVSQVDARMKEFEDAKAKAPYEAAPISEKKMEKGEERIKTRQEYETDIKAQTAIIDSPDTTVTVEQKKAAHEKRGEAEDAVKKLDAQEKRDHRMETVAKYKKEEADSRKEDDAMAAEKLAELEGNSPEKKGEEAKKEPEKPADVPAAPNAPASAPENNPSLSDQADRFAGNMVVNIIGSPPKTGWDKFTTNTKVILMQIGLAIAGGGNHSWGAKLSEPEREIAKKVMGLTITDDGEVPKVDATATSPEIAAIPKCKLEWGKPDPEFMGPDKTTQDVFAQYFGKGDWLKTYERVCELAEGKPTIKDIEGSYSTPHTPEDDKLAQLITDMGVGDKKDDNFLDMVSRKGYLVLDKDTNTETDSEKPRISIDTKEMDRKIEETSLGIISENHLDSNTKIQAFLNLMTPPMIKIMFENMTPEIIETFVRTLPKEKALALVNSADLSAEQKTKMTAELEKDGKLSLESAQELFKMAQTQIFEQFTSGSVDWVKIVDRMPDCDIKTAVKDNVPLPQFLNAEIAAGRSVESNTAMLKALQDNDKNPTLLSRVSFEMKKDEAATQKLNEWGVGFSGKTMVDPMGKTLHTFEDKDQVSLQLSDDGNISMKVKTEADEKSYSLIADTDSGTVILKELTSATPAVSVDAKPASPAPAPTPSSPTAS